MKALALAEQLAAGGQVQDLSGPSRTADENRVFRISSGGDNRILKVYGAPSRARRERHALEALSTIDGVPAILEQGSDGDLAWAFFDDPGRWNLASLPENPGLARQAGLILRAVHESAPNPVSNLARGIDQEWVAVDFISTFRRLERFRRRIGVSLELLQAARQVRPPSASEPCASHTDPRPESFMVDDAGNVTLINWEWATLAPPEWDLSKAVWRTGVQAGPIAASNLQEGYGKTLEVAQLDRWIVYHAGMTLVYQAEQQASHGTSESYADLVAELQRAVTASRAPETVKRAET